MEKQQLSKLLSHTVNKNVKFWYMFFHDAVRTQVIGTESKKKVREKGCSFQSFVLLLKNYFWPVKTYSPVEPLLRKKASPYLKNKTEQKKSQAYCKNNLSLTCHHPYLLVLLFKIKGMALGYFQHYL